MRVSFVNPQGIAASWITADDVHLVDVDGAEATSYLMYHTESGTLNWERYGVQDETGTWSVDFDLDGNEYSTAYTMDELQIGGQVTVSVGVDLTKNSGGTSTVYYSDLVPTALMVDRREHLSDAAFLLEQRTGTKMGQLPDLYLMGNREIMERVSAATGVNLGYEDGYFKNYGTRPGIYMRTDLLSTDVRRLLTHEYVHLVFDDLANGKVLPAWLTEGLSRFYEFDIALSGPRANASQPRRFRAADLARTAAQEDSLFSLAALDSQSNWNSRTDLDLVSLQYAEAYMAIRFLNETYGAQSAKKVVESIGRGIGLPNSIEAVTGHRLPVFETQFILWLRDWQDPSRAAIAEYLAALKPILADLDDILAQRSKDLSTVLTAGEAAIRRVSRLTSTEALIDQAQSLSPPDGALDLHQEAEEYLGRVLDWLTLEFKHADTRDDVYRVAANAMIPEVNAREFLLQRNMSSLEFILHLRE